MSKQVKNKTGKDLAIPEVGVVKAGEVATVPNGFNNPNFEAVKSGAKTETKTAASSKGDKNTKTK